MSERQQSVADQFVHVMGEISRMDDGVDNDNQHRYPIRMLKEEAINVICDALTTADRIASLVRVLCAEIDAMDARKQP